MEETPTDRFDRQSELIRRYKTLNSLFYNQLSEKQDPFFMYSDWEFKSRFRFTKECVKNKMLPNVLQKLECKFGSQLSPLLQLFIALRFYACGAFQKVIGDSIQVSQSTVHRIVKNVSVAIAQERQKYIQFPSLAKAAATRVEFMKIARFPGVTGIIDCTHIGIVNPGGPNSEVFRNRKGKFSINVQVVCDVDMKLTNKVARWPGSTHDSRIYLASRLHADLASGRLPSHLLGDSGYGVSANLLTPLLNPQTESEKRYNAALKSTRSMIERTIGIWKKKFACLGSQLRTKLNTSLAIIVACGILHNIAVTSGQYDLEDEIEEDEDDQAGGGVDGDENGHAYRSRIIRDFF